MSAEAPFVLLHVSGCGKPAVRLTHRPMPAEPLRSADVRHLDGSKLEFGSRAICDACGGPLIIAGFGMPGAPIDVHTDNVREVGPDVGMPGGLRESGEYSGVSG